MTGSFNRVHDEKGFILLAVLFVAILYFGLLLIIYREQSELARSVQRYRSSVIAKVMAENAAEMVAVRMADTDTGVVDDFVDETVIRATYTRKGKSPGFVIEADAKHLGVARARAHVTVEGRILPGEVVIDSTVHSRLAAE